MKLSPTERFSFRVESYIKYRPAYPKEIIQYLKTNAGLKSKDVVADFGSGTGILSKLFLDNGNTVLCVEPNKPMREAAEKLLKDYKNFVSINGKAESSDIENNSVDFIIAGQAFHWFDPVETRKEFKKIAHPNAKVVLIWNDRDTVNDEFQKDYEEILTHLLPEYVEVTHKNISVEMIKEFVSPSQLHIASFDHFQTFDFDGLIGRLISSSYCPDENSELYSIIKSELYTIFKKHRINNIIKFNYKTMVYWAEMVE